MPSDDDLWKRDNDKRWRERADERLASLTTSENVQNDRLDGVEEQLACVDKILRGDLDKDTSGIVEHLHEVQTGLNALRALMAPDALGAGGIINRLKALEKREARSEYHWKFWIAVIGFVSATVVALITNADRLERALRRESPAAQLDRLQQEIVGLKKQRGPNVKRRLKELEEAADSMQSAPETWR